MKKLKQILRGQGGTKYFVRTGMFFILFFVVTGSLYLPQSQISNVGITYADGTGGTITHSGGYTIHTFTDVGTFSFNPGNATTSVEVLVVAGGGGGAAMTGGGGGAGGLLYDANHTVTSQAYTVTVGNYGAGQIGTANPGFGSDGGNSVFDNMTAIGGGGAGTNAASNGRSGGSGGSCGHVNCTGGSGTSGQGYAGGSQITTAPHYGSGGGGGAGHAGYPGTTNEGGGNGGDGLPYSISGSSVYYAGGGGGGSYPANGTLGTGGLGGGGNAPAGNATPNTGGGGGGQYNNLANGGNGGTGIVIIRYLTPPEGITISGSLYASDETTPVTTGTVKMSIAGGTATTTPVDGSGNWSFIDIAAPTAGQVVTIWMDAGSTAGTNNASLVFKYGSVCEGGTSDCTGLKLYQTNTIIGVDYNNTANTITNADLAACDNDTGTGCSDTDIGFTSNSGTLTATWTTSTLRIKDANAKFAPGGAVSTKSFKQSDGSFSGGSSAITINSNYTLSGGTFTSTSGTLTVKGNYTHTAGGTFNHNSGTVSFDAPTTVSLDVSTTETFNNLSFGATGTYGDIYNIGSGDTLIALGTFTHTTYPAGDNWARINTGTIEARGNIVINANTGGGTATLSFVTSGDQTITGPAPGSDAISLNFDINKPSGTLTASGDFSVGNFTLSSGTFTSTSGLLGIKGNYIHTAGGTFNHNNGTVNFYTQSSTVSIDVSTTETFNNLSFGSVNTFSDTYNIGTGDTLIALGNFTHTSLPGGDPWARVNTGTIEVRGNVVINTNTYGGTASLVFSGSGAQTYTNNGGTNLTGGFTINKSSGTVTLSSNLTLASALTITSGTLDQGATYNLITGGLLTVGASGILSNTGTGDLTLGGNVSNAGTITMNGGGASCGDADGIAITAASARTWSGAGTFNLTDVALTNQTASVAITVASGTNTSGNTGSWTWGVCGVTISGTIYGADEATPLSGTPTIKLSVAGTASTTVNLSSGDFTFSSLPVEPTPGDVITIWIDGGSDRATLVFKYGSVCEGGTTDCTGLSLYKDNVIIGVDYNNTANTITNTDLSACDNDTGTGCSDTDIGFTSNAGTLTATWTTSTLRIKDANAKFVPGGDITISGLKQSAGAFGSDGSTDWYNSSWSYRKAITIDNTKVTGSADLTGFPILIDLTDADLAANAQADGDDILFTSSDGITKLNHEIEIYASATGRLTAWASTTLDFDNDTVIYMYYGNSGATSQQNATGVWDSNYKGVWHLPNGTTLTANDSTSNAYNGTLVNTPTATAGQADGAAQFVKASSQYITNAGVPVTTYPITLQAWVKLADTSFSDGDDRVIVSVVKKSGLDEFWLGYYRDGGVNYIRSVAQANTATNTRTLRVSKTLDTNWHHIVAVLTSSTTQSIYFDSVLQSGSYITIGTGLPQPSGLSDTYIGALIYNSSTFFGGMGGNEDEVRISNTARSVDWINTEYNNQSATSTFYAIGTQESPNSSNWYDEAYTKRKSHVITGSGGAGTNYQVKIIAYKATGTDSGGTVYLGTGIQDDFDDVRFTDNDGITPLDFWIASTTSGVSAEFWVEVQDTLESNATIYTYYQNTSATSGANGNNTFLFFDDFSGASLDLDKWTAFNVDSTSQSGGILSINNTIKDPSKVIADLNGGGQTGSNVAMRARYRITGGSHSDQRIGLSVKTDVANGQSYNYVMHDFANKDERQFLDDSIAWGTSNAEPFASNTWYIEEIYHSGTAVVARYDDGTWYSWTRSGRSGYLALNPGGYSDVVSSDWDYAFIRKIVSTEPTHGTWGEEELSAIDISLYGPLNISGGTFISTGSNLNFVGDSAQTITNSGGTVTLGPVIINKTNNSDTVTLASHLTLGDTLTITKGLLSQGSSYSLTTGGLLMVDTNGTLRNRGTGDLTLGGDVTNTGTIIMNSNNGTQCVDGENDIAIMSSSNGVQRTWSGAGTFTVYNVAVTDMLDSGITITAYNSTLTNSDWAVGGGCASYGGGGGGVFSSAELPGGGGTLVTGGDEGGGGGSSVVGITFDSSSASAHHTNGSPITWNHTVGSGTNTLLIVGCSIYSESSQPTATVATFNNVGMTKIRADQTPASLGYIETSIWFLHAPASGTHEVSLTVTFSGINNGGGCVSASYAGAQQVDTADASSGLTGTGTGSKSFTVTTVADNAWVFAVGGNKAGPGIAITAEQTSRGSITGTPRPNAEDTNAAVTPSGGVTMGFTISGLSAYWSMTGASFAPAAGSSESGSGGGTLQTGGGSGGGGSAAP